MTNPIQFTPPVFRSAEPSEERAPSTSTGGASFADVLKKAVNDASDLQTNAEELIAAFVRGEPVELHQVMAASEEAGITLDLLVEIRNKLTEAYRTVMSMG